MCPFKCNPFMVHLSVPKSPSSERRVILDLSFPKKGDIVNSYIPKDWFYGDNVERFFPNVDDSISFILNTDHGA